MPRSRPEWNQQVKNQTVPPDWTPHIKSPDAVQASRQKELPVKQQKQPAQAMGQAAKEHHQTRPENDKNCPAYRQDCSTHGKNRHQYGGSYSNGGSENGTGCYKDRESDRPGRPRHGKVRRRCRENHRKGRFCCGKGPACVCQGAGGRYRRWRLGCYPCHCDDLLDWSDRRLSLWPLLFWGGQRHAPDHTHRCPGDQPGIRG